MLRPRRALDDIRHARNLEAYIIGLLSLTIAALSAFGITNSALVSAATLTVLGALVVALAQFSSASFGQSTGTIGSLRAFNEDRANLAPMHERLKTCRRSFRVWGVQLAAFEHEYLNNLEELARSGREVELLMMSPIDKDGQVVSWLNEVGRVHSFTRLGATLEQSALRLAEWHEGLSVATRGRVRVRLYCSIPTVSAILVDHNLSSGWIQVEPLIFGVPPAKRANLTVTALSDFGIRITDAFEQLWEESLDLEDSKAFLGGLDFGAGRV